jgi:hypothetical protein
MEAEPTYEGPADAPDETTGSPPAAPQPEVADPPARVPLLNTFRRLARFSTHSRRWHTIDEAPGGRGDGADNDQHSGER